MPAAACRSNAAARVVRIVMKIRLLCVRFCTELPERLVVDLRCRILIYRSLRHRVERSLGWLRLWFFWALRVQRLSALAKRAVKSSARKSWRGRARRSRAFLPRFANHNWTPIKTHPRTTEQFCHTSVSYLPVERHHVLVRFWTEVLYDLWSRRLWRLEIPPRTSRGPSR